MIKTIFFDLGNVITDFDETDMFKQWAAASNKPVSEIIKFHQGSRTRKAYERGEISSEQHYKKILEELDMKIKFNDFKKGFNEIFTLNKDVEKLIRKLKGKYKLILLSNTNKMQYEYIKGKYKILEELDDYILSYEVGCRKPNPLIYYKALKKAKTLSFNCAYFDDIGEFIVVARTLGIKAFQFRNYKKLVNDLKKVGVL
jgi:putative hydrolase of the HAD superfamily|tara:strand:- start:7977 stop:8576 length:600 start_codon:yes stop_codon:yes gene_type:complete